MGLDKRTIKIIVIIVVTLITVGSIIGLLLFLLLPRSYVVLEVWPQSDDYNYHEPLIQFREQDPGTWYPWFRKINDFLREYETTVPEEPPRAPCSVQPQERRPPVPSCEQVQAMWAPCNVDNFYGYKFGRPCVFLRLSHIHYWVPEPYNVSVPLPIPHDMPEHIKHVMRQRPAHQVGDYIWVSCDGEFMSDKENMGPIQYIPHGLPPGFPTSRLHTADRIPYSARGMPDTVPGPLVAVHFENPRRGVLINVECRIWSRDIIYDPSSRTGRARFELYVE